MRSYCLYNDKHVSIAEIFEIKDGKQINIPEKLAYYRPLSKNKQLSCSCGCGDIVILIAGEKNKRRQHFRLLRKSANSNCQYHEESDISFKSKIMLECWFKKNFSVMYCGMRYKVPISQLAENKRRYELSMYSKDYDIGIIYNRHIANILDEKLELLKEYVKTKIIYVTGVDNEETNGQYPEHMMRVQETQGFCFYLDLNKESLYEEVKAKVSFYEKTFRGLWKVVDVCCGMLDEFGINTDGLLVYKDELVIDLVDKRREKFQAEQKCKLEQIIKCEEEKKLRQEKESLEKVERERLSLEKERKEQENRARVEKERQKQRELEQRRKKEERKVYNEKEDNSFLEKYPKYARIYKMLKEMMCRYMKEELGTILIAELILAKKYFEKGQSFNFFGKIQKGRKDLSEILKNMAWDLHHLRLMEYGCVKTTNLFADFFVPYFYTYDKRLLEAKECYKLEALAIDKQTRSHYPFYAHENEVMPFVQKLGVSNNREIRLPLSEKEVEALIAKEEELLDGLV